MINIDKINELMSGIKGDVEKLEKGVKAAAPRIRKTLMEVSRLCKICRKEVQEIKSTGVASPEEKSEPATETNPEQE